MIRIAGRASVAAGIARRAFARLDASAPTMPALRALPHGVNQLHLERAYSVAPGGGDTAMPPLDVVPDSAHAARLPGRGRELLGHASDWLAGAEVWVSDSLEALGVTTGPRRGGPAGLSEPSPTERQSASPIWTARAQMARRLAYGSALMSRRPHRAMSTQASAVSACAHAAAPSGAAAPAASELAPASSATTNQAPSPPEPQRVLLRVRGTSMQYTPLLFSWHDLGAMSGLQLLDELARSVLFGSRFRDVCFLDACVVSIFKGPQPSGSRSPTADEDLDDANFVDVQSDEPVRAAAARAGVGKGTMFILVRPAPVLLSSDEEALLASVQHSVVSFERHASDSPKRAALFLKRGEELLRARSLTGSAPQLSGVLLASFMAGTVKLPGHFIQHLMSTRGVSLRGIAAGVATRMAQHMEAPTAAPTHALGNINATRVVNPLIALQSAPGGGKSTVLDCAAVLSTHRLWDNVCDGAAPRDFLNKCVPVSVTYNSGSDANVSGYDNDIETGFALRTIHSFFSPVVSFSRFAKWLPQGAKLEASVAVRTCLTALRKAGYGDRGILLLVDEIIKLGPQAKQVLSLVGSLLDEFPPQQFNAVVTTLDARPFIDMKTASGRELIWAPLPALSQTATESMMGAALHVSDLPQTLRVAISDCAGHPRTLEYLGKAALLLKQTSGNAWLSGDPSLLPALRQLVIARLQTPVQTWAVRAALFGAAAKLRDPIPGSPDSQQSLSQHIANGTFLNTNVDAADSVVPQLSLMHLLMAADPAIRDAIEQLAAADEDAFRAPKRMGGSPFEMFVAHWLRLRLLIAENETITLQQLLKPAGVGTYLPPSLLTMSLRASSSISCQFCKQSVAGVPQGSLKPNVVYTFGNNNAGFDSLVILEASAGGTARVALAIESRFSKPGGSRSDSTGDVTRKDAAWREQLQHIQRAYGAPITDAVLVYVAVGDVKLPAAERQELEQQRQVVVLDRSAAAAWFTPTLADRAFFTLDLPPPDETKA